MGGMLSMADLIKTLQERQAVGGRMAVQDPRALPAGTTPGAGRGYDGGVAALPAQPALPGKQLQPFNPNEPIGISPIELMPPKIPQQQMGWQTTETYPPIVGTKPAVQPGIMKPMVPGAMPPMVNGGGGNVAYGDPGAGGGGTSMEMSPGQQPSNIKTPFNPAVPISGPMRAAPVTTSAPLPTGVGVKQTFAMPNKTPFGSVVNPAVNPRAGEAQPASMVLNRQRPGLQRGQFLPGGYNWRDYR